jgi:predicted TIM-barrel fold metal-dependent hydrolase
MRAKKTDRELPILLPFVPGQASNGEFVPKERTRAHLKAEALAHEMAERIAKKQGVDRRRFLMSASGMAVTLAAINMVGCDDEDTRDLPEGVDSGGTFNTPADADPDAVCEMLEGDEFIFDVQTHHVDPEGPWVNESPATAGAFRLYPGDPSCNEADRLDCLSRYYYAHDIFLESDTSIAVLSDTPSGNDSTDPLNFDEMKRTRDIMNELSPANTGRLRLHSVVVPNAAAGLEAALERMQARAEALDVAAWKVYTPYAGTSGGWMLDDDIGMAVIETARATGVKTICAHKGLPLFGFDRAAASPRDIGVAAAAFPDMNFVVYHSGWFPGRREASYSPDTAEGVDVLIRSLQDNGVQPNTNVYAELGSTWRNIMSDRTQAAHLLGKLMKYVGEDNVLWGTDCIWTGSPQPQIVAMRAFNIEPRFAQEYGYSLLTDDVKRKIFGANAARLYGVDSDLQKCKIERDQVEDLRQTYMDLEAETHEIRWAPKGPTTRRGMLRWFADHGGRWQLG